MGSGSSSVISGSGSGIVVNGKGLDLDNPCSCCHECSTCGTITYKVCKAGHYKPTTASGNRSRRSAAESNSTIANSNSEPVSLYFKKEKMVTSDLIQDGRLATGGDLEYLMICPGQSMVCPVEEHLYVTAFAVDPRQLFVCPTNKPLFENFLVEGPIGAQKSYIYTSGGIKVAKTGQIWVGEDGVDYEPKH